MAVRIVVTNIRYENRPMVNVKRSALLDLDIQSFDGRINAIDAALEMALFSCAPPRTYSSIAWLTAECPRNCFPIFGSQLICPGHMSGDDARMTREAVMTYGNSIILFTLSTPS